MLDFVVSAKEIFNEETNEFIYTKEYKLQLEHSLISLQKWESLTHKKFLSDLVPKTNDDILLYIKCMTLNKVPDEVYKYLSNEEKNAIFKYINDPMTATVFNDINSKGDSNPLDSDKITAEIIYYYMVSYNIPMECRKWHLNQLLTLIRVCNIKNQPNKKIPINETINNYAAMNARRRKQLNSRG